MPQNSITALSCWYHSLWVDVAKEKTKSFHVSRWASVFPNESWLNNKIFCFVFVSELAAPEATFYLNLRNPSKQKVVYKIISHPYSKFLGMTSESGVLEPGAVESLGSKNFDWILFTNFLIIPIDSQLPSRWKRTATCRTAIDSRSSMRLSASSCGRRMSSTINQRRPAWEFFWCTNASLANAKSTN